MGVQYLLPCECGSTTPIETSHAGSSVACKCGRQLEVPSLRAIRELSIVRDVADSRKYQWNPAAGMVFVTGLILALVGACVALFMHVNARQAVNFDLPPEQHVADWIAEIDNTPPEKLLEEWNVARHVGLGDYQMSPWVQGRILAERLALYRNTSLIVMASGLAFAGTSILLRRKSS